MAQRPFPRHTIVLMLLTLLAFVWFYWATHHLHPARRPEPVKAVPAPAPAR